MTTMPAGYYNRFNSAKNYDEHLFRAGKVLQSAELNEVQTNLATRMKGIADVLFKDGAIVRGCAIQVNVSSGATTLESGAIYLKGMVRGIPPGSFTIPMVGVISVGIYLTETVATELDDPELRDPAVGVRNYQEPGASRLKVDPAWGHAGDGHSGEFYPVYSVTNGVVDPKEPPPAIDAIALAVSRYDRQSTGGYYVSNGLGVMRLADESGAQVYSLSEGVARVAGNEIVLQHGKRIVYETTPDPKLVSLEPHVAAGGTETITLNHSPLFSVEQISVTKEKTVTITHGAFTGVSDALEDSPVTSIVEVKQGGTTYVAGTDYTLSSDKVNWSPTGAEPAPGSTYTVKYRYLATITANSTTATSVTISSAVAGTTIQISYKWSMPRIDRLCLDSSGAIVWVKGVPSPYAPKAPDVPFGHLGIASVYQRWTAQTSVVSDAVRMVPMNEINGMNSKIDTLFALVAEERLALNAAMSDPTAKKGVFSDAFYDDDLRDQGAAQTAAIYQQDLTLAVDAVVLSQSLGSVKTLDARVITEVVPTVGPTEVVLQQLLKTGSMKINPYDSFSPLPGVALLEPATDFWTDFQTQWLSPVTRQFHGDVWTNPDVRNYWMNFAQQRGYDLNWWTNIHTTVVRTEQSQSAEVEKVGTKYVDLQYLRQIPVRFNISGFGGGENLTSVKFDGRSVPFTAV